ncbi:MAG: 3-dehydroquinate synthase [Gemmatimonadaceae bacterium]|nr:3-dehydroquinate synthase [Gemmatimonadaceae bacterium]
MVGTAGTGMGTGTDLPASEFALHGARIVVRAGALADAAALVRECAPGCRPIVVTDANVAPLHAAPIAAALGADMLTFAAGEASKVRAQWAALTDELLARQLGRDTVVVAVGGGVCGDLAGFVAATYLRGVPVVQVPTSLVAMIDAAIGGKTGVDTRHGKNLVGAFHQPALVLIDPLALRTLPANHRRAGMAEAIKHGVIADESYFHWIAAHGAALLTSAVADDLAERLVLGSVAVKVRVVAGDEREGGRRRILNFGHTIGHAVEHLSTYEILHGDAVAIGMVAEARLGELAGWTLHGLADEIGDLCTTIGLPVHIPPAFDADAIIALMRGDKKARSGVAEYALPLRCGEMNAFEGRYALALDEAIVRAAIDGTR